MFQTSENRNNEIVKLELSIGQCKLLESLTDSELASAEVGTSSFCENALKTLIDVFMSKTQETEAEREVRFENWVNGTNRMRANHG
ncbi:MAG: hypothetical protein Q7T42_11560 [Methylotenera sp.]|uniref:hypothetical protein n=1 Tax=Methylotenera sp. TaxID=2051956 RepID=UPI0027163A2A|nr:hypothetical protein [Methylotenera sp.]MDO9394597.1 hypothetical protein [Methylotenera sp.]MDP1522843.1 hypothetical protein [Methylotenera sp.]